jgi:hypothetical protein
MEKTDEQERDEPEREIDDLDVPEEAAEEIGGGRQPGPDPIPVPYPN